jgi:sodium transport system permease protein
MHNGILIVFRKETLDNLRDRRTLLLGLVYPLLGPILLGAMISLATTVLTAKPEKPVRLGIENAEAAPRLVAYLRQHDIEPELLERGGDKLVRDGRYDSVIVIPSDYADRLASESSISVPILIHPARLGSMVGANRVYALLDAYGRQLAQERLLRRGIDPASATPIVLKSVNVAGDATIVDIFMFMVPPFFIFTIFMGGVYLVLDTTSGERERGSLEPLLVNPVPRWGLMGGKFLSGVLFTTIGLIVQLIAFKVAFLLAGNAGVSLARNLDLATMSMILITALPLMTLAVAIQIIVAVGTKSFKEAQTYLGLLPLVPAIPGMVLVFSPVQAQSWMMALPTFGQTLIFGRLVRGEGMALSNLFISASVTLIATAFLLAIAARLYENESLIFGK